MKPTQTRRKWREKSGNVNFQWWIILRCCWGVDDSTRSRKTCEAFRADKTSRFCVINWIKKKLFPFHHDIKLTFSHILVGCCLWWAVSSQVGGISHLILFSTQTIWHQRQRARRRKKNWKRKTFAFVSCIWVFPFFLPPFSLSLSTRSCENAFIDCRTELATELVCSYTKVTPSMVV